MVVAESGVAGDQGPKYVKIHKHLGARIVRGEWPAGTQLPPQRQMCEEYGVTLMTLRQALQLLEDEGLIEQRHGKGTFVRSLPYSYDVGHLRSFSQDMGAQGAKSEIRLLSAGVVKPMEAVAARLGLPPDRGVFELRRLRSVGGRPVVLQSSYLAPTIGAHLPRQQLATRSLYAVLRAQLGLRVVKATELIAPVVLDEQEAELLDREPGTPAMRSRHLSLMETGQPLIDDIAVMPGDNVSIMARRDANGVRLRYSFAVPAPDDGEPD